MMDMPQIRVAFKDGTKDIFVLKHHVALPYSRHLDPSQICNYIGYLKHESGSVVAVTGCLKMHDINSKMYITLLSERSRYQKYFVIDTYGNFEGIKPTNIFIPDEISSRNDVEFVEGDEIGDIEEEEESKSVIIGGKNKVPFAIKAKIKIGVDVSACNTIVHQLDTSVDQWLSDVMTHVQAIFHHPTLHHRINFEVHFNAIMQLCNIGLFYIIIDIL